METGEDVLASEEGTRGGPSNCEGGIREVARRQDHRTSRKKKLSRKVSFPEDAFLVRAVDPVDPWENAGHHSSKEVIDAYRSTCIRLKIKPCEKLIKQLEACESFADRIDVIDLRGVKLDPRNCEALEEVFRRVRTKTLDLENTGLEDDGAVSLLEMIEYYKSTCNLNMAYNSKIKIRGWQAVSRTLKKTPCLQYLDIRNTVWTEQALPLLGRTLRLDCCLSVLHMEGCNLSGRPLFLLVSAVKFNQNLKDLFLGDNKLTSPDGQSLGAMLKGNGYLQLLDLRNNPLQDMGIGYICEGLAEQPHGGLQTLVLWNTQLTCHGAMFLANALVSTSSLQTLNLGHNRLTNEGMHTLKEGLLRNHSLERLGLLNTRLSSEGIIALAEVVAESKTILRVDLRDNDPYVGGLMALSLSLKVNKSLVRIDLDKDLKKEPGMETTQRIILADIYSYCQRNKVLAKEREERELATESQTEEGRISETDSIIHDVKEHVTDAVSHVENETASGSPKLIQLENPPDIAQELKVLTSDYPGLSRFTVTAVSDEEQQPNQDGTFSDEDFVPLVDLSNTNCSSNGQDISGCGMSVNDVLRDKVSGVSLSDTDASNSTVSSLSQPTASPLIPALVQSDERTSASSPLPEGNKPELDLLSSVSVKETNHNPHLNHAINNQDFWTGQMDGLMIGSTKLPTPPSTVSPNNDGAVVDLLS